MYINNILTNTYNIIGKNEIHPSMDLILLNVVGDGFVCAKAEKLQINSSIVNVVKNTFFIL
jgi:hypothetical protein